MTHGDSAMHHTSSFHYTLSGAVFAVSTMATDRSVANWRHPCDLTGCEHLDELAFVGFWHDLGHLYIPTNDYGRRHHPYPHADYPLEPESVRSRLTTKRVEDS